MHAGLALLLTAVAFRDTTGLLAGRFGDGMAALPLAAVVAALSWPVMRRIWRGTAAPVSALLGDR